MLNLYQRRHRYILGTLLVSALVILTFKLNGLREERVHMIEQADEVTYEVGSLFDSQLK